MDVVDEDDPYCHLAEDMGRIVNNMGNNGFSSLDIAPWCK